MEVLNAIINWFLKGRLGQIEYFMKNPIETQERVFHDLIATARDTEWGKKHGYGSMKSQANFMNNVPISSYEDIYPLIERTLKGEQNILWPSEVRWFSKSSGTTNARSKYIPITKESLEDCHIKAGKDMMGLYNHRNPNSRIFSGKNLGIGGSFQANPTGHSDIQCGDVSAIIMKNLPFWAEMVRTPNMEINLMSEWEEKIERIANITSKENVTSISGVPTWTIVLLERILEITGKNNIAEVWPNLELFNHGAVAFAPYREIFKKLIPKEDLIYVEIYNASEGFFAIQDTDQPDEMLLMLDYGVYYEFIPMDQVHKEHPKVLTIGEVELGKNYALLISTNGGLWRYQIGDTIRFTSINPYRIKISGRVKHYINAFGEEVVIENADEALVRASEATNAQIKEYTVAPIYLESGRKGRHEWVIEFIQEPEDFEKFSEIIDQTLRSINSDYDAKRYKDMALIKPMMHKVSKGTFYDWMKKRKKLGGQNKVPRLSNTREYMDDLLLFLDLK